MTRLSSAFPSDRAALVTFITAGDAELGRVQNILANLCGRGDKDIFTVAEALGAEI